MEASPDILRLRESRIAVLEVLIAFGMRLLRGLRIDAGGPVRSVVAIAKSFERTGRWVRVAIFLSFRVDDGALDGPRPPKKARVRGAARVEVTAVGKTETEAEDRPERGRREYERLERYLDMPFGEAVGRICKGLGMRPDWAAWSAEPWAQEEIRTRPEGSPYAGDAAEPPAEQSERHEPPPVPPKPGPEPHALAQPEPPRRPPPGPPPNRKARRIQARMARKRAAQTRAPFARAAG